MICAQIGRINHKNSKGEGLVCWALNKLKITYSQERVIDLTNYGSSWARVDFYINEKIPTIIEYNGKQHYEESSKFGKSSFIRQQKRDKALVSFCKDKNIRLITIKYTVGPKTIIKELIKALSNPESSNIQ